ncbi:early nodulin-like protein 1 [Rosa sericea]
MNGNYVMILVIAMAATGVLMVHRAEAAEYVVGDDLGWTIPPHGAADYESWASDHSLTVDDILVFKFSAGEQDFAFVSKEDFLTCNTANPFHACF